MIQLKVRQLSSVLLVTLLAVNFSGFAQPTFSNPIRDGADPWVFQKDGEYYYCASQGGGIAISKSNKLTDQGEMVQVWKSPDSGWNSANIWAPEIHFIEGRWYIYYAAGSKSGSPFIHQRSGVLRSVGRDAFGPYEDLGMLYTGDHIGDSASVVWAIDLTPWQPKGRMYAIWSGWEENRDTDKTQQHLYIAEMSNPYTISSNRVKITSPVEPWETGGPLNLIEGPQMLERNGKTFIVYSTRESWLKEYRLGQLTLREGADPMVPESWLKKGPVFIGNDLVLGAGHCSFAKSPDGTEDWILYHSKKTAQPGWNRDVRLQRFGWHADGSPDFGTPIPAGVAIPVPSGE
ncbi:glycoside hydrolase family 43 protein [Lunatimonas salinarum]|uniref:glycoside hydrolase family 43 protein n=1 Tax=Lunatimonas salinarum TaxID=1774590 RepID=UPI001ADF4726|nr:glycoside hydrolase family 43 protein [Lunatimonas salinarum]